MAGKHSAGLILFRENNGNIEVLLVHPGGPYWANKDEGAWSIPKGEFGADEDPLEVARREFEEETGAAPPEGEYTALGDARQPGGKVVHAWAVRGDIDPGALRSNTFTMEWPPQSGQRQSFPEVDRAAWLSLPEAERRILKGQLPLLDRLRDKLDEIR